MVVLMQVPSAVATRSVGENASPLPLLSIGASVASFACEGPWVASQCKLPVYSISTLTMSEYLPLIYHVERSRDISKYFHADQAHHDRNNKRFLHSGRNDKKESLRTYRRFLNLVGVPGKFVTEDASKIDIVKNDHIGVVFFVVVVLPALVPPAKTDNCRPAI